MKIAYLPGLFLVAAVLLLFSAPDLPGQSAGTGALTGTVTDPSGAAVPNATVTATNNENGQTRTSTTGNDGGYRFSLLPPGTYRVRFGAVGFKVAEVPAVQVDVAETPVLNRALEVGGQSETVQVEAQAAVLQTADSTLGTTVGTRTVTELPLASRNYTQILSLSAGAAAAVNNATSFGKGTQDMSVNGNNSGQNNFQMDGVAINNIANRGSANDAGIYGGIGVPNPDAIQEFKIQTSTYDASYGRNPGANVNVVTRSGTNSWHGTAFEFFRNAQLNANDFFYNRSNPDAATKKQILNQNQFGGSFGGPIRKDKLFVFGSYQGTRSRNAVAPQGNSTGLNLFAVPDGDRGSNGVLPHSFASALIASNCKAPGIGPGISCSATSVDPAAARILQLKNTDGSYYIPSTGNQFVQRSYSLPAVFQEDQTITNGDYLINPKNTLAGRFFYSRSPRTVTNTAPFGGSLPGGTTQQEYDNTNAVLKLTTLATNSFVNEARTSFQRNIAQLTDSLPPGASPTNLGITPLVANARQGADGSAQAPPISLIFNNYTLFGFLQPVFSPSTQIQWADQISWTHGKHTLRAGYEYERTQWDLVFGGLGRGWFLMGSFSNLLHGGPILQCLFCVRSGQDGIIHGYRLPNQNAFVHDDWKVSSKLTLNLGVRWEYDGTLSDHYGNLTNTWLERLAPNSQLPTRPSAPNQGPAALYQGYVVPSNYDKNTWALPNGVLQSDSTLPIKSHPPYSNFGPRVGFAYQALDKLVIRGGAGIFYDRVGADRFVHSVQEGNPYAATVSSPLTATLDNPYPPTPLQGQFGQRWVNPNADCVVVACSSGLNHPFLDNLIHTPVVRQYNVNFQYEFALRWVLEAGYVGSGTINLTDYNHNYNQAQIASAAHPVNGITTTTTNNVQLRVPYLGFGAQGLQGTAWDGVSNYNSLQITVRKQLSHGVSLQAAYTFSKALSDIFQATANSNVSTDLAQQYGPTEYNRSQRFVVNYNWDLPLGKHSGATGKLLEGWNLSGVTVVQNGAPVTLIDTRGGTAYGTSTTTIEGGYSRPQMCPGQTYAQIPSSGSIQQRLGALLPNGTVVGGFWNQSAFCAPPVIGSDGVATGFGNAGVGVLLGPGQFNFDASVLKTTRITERQSLQFRAEVFNLFNHPQFAFGQLGGVNSLLDVSSPTSRLVTSTSVNPRIVQLALKYVF